MALFTRNQFCILKKLIRNEEYLYVCDKPSLSTALCLFPDGRMFTTSLLKYVELTADELKEIFNLKSKFELNKLYDLETFLAQCSYK